MWTTTFAPSTLVLDMPHHMWLVQTTQLSSHLTFLHRPWSAHNYQWTSGVDKHISVASTLLRQCRLRIDRIAFRLQTMSKRHWALPTPIAFGLHNRQSTKGWFFPHYVLPAHNSEPTWDMVFKHLPRPAHKKQPMWPAYNGQPM